MTSKITSSIFIVVAITSCCINNNTCLARQVEPPHYTPSFSVYSHLHLFEMIMYPSCEFVYLKPTNTLLTHARNSHRHRPVLDTLPDQSLPPTFIYPSVVIEVTSDNFRTSQKAIKDNGPLHPSRFSTLLHCVEIENTLCGCYLAFKLGKRPHYQLDRSLPTDRKIEDTANKHNIPYQRLSRSLSHHIHDVVTVINQGTSEFSKVQPIMNSLRFEDYLDKGLQEQHHTSTTTNRKPSARAPMTWSYGYTSQNQGATRRYNCGTGCAC